MAPPQLRSAIARRTPCSEFRDEVGVALGRHLSAPIGRPSGPSVRRAPDVQWLQCLPCCSRSCCWWLPWCLAQCCPGLELHPGAATTFCELAACQRRRHAPLLLDLQLALTCCAHRISLLASSTLQLPLLISTRPAVQVACRAMHRHRAARVGPCETCLQRAGSAVCS